MQGCLRKGSMSFVCLAVVLAGCLRFSTRHDVSLPSASRIGGDVVAESAREIPVLYDVDVLVVGGSSGAVSAAVAAAQEGAKVFLAAPRPYLGEDLCGTYRLWLEPDEEPTSPLAAALFAEPNVARSPHNDFPFTYEADVESAAPHKDSPASDGLRDGKWQDATSQSVQYNSDVNVVVDLGSEQTVGTAHVMAYQRNDEFEVADVVVSASSDKQQWQQLAVVANKRLGEGSFERTPIPLSTTVDRKVRYLRFTLHKTPDAKRVII